MFAQRKQLFLVVLVLSFCFAKVFTTVPHNLAFRKPTDSNVVEVNEDLTCCLSSFAVDGFGSTKFYSEENQVFFFVDLGDVYEFSIIEISWDEYPSTFAVLTALGFPDFTTIFYAEGETNLYSSEIRGNFIGRYILVYLIEFGYEFETQFSGYGLEEIEVYRECSPNTGCNVGCCNNEGICVEECSTDPCVNGVCYEGFCEYGGKDCSDGDWTTLDFCESGVCSSEVVGCTPSFYDLDNLVTSGVGEYGAAIDLTPNQFVVYGGDGGNGPFYTQMCVQGSGSGTWLLAYETSDSSIFWDPPYYIADGKFVILNPFIYWGISITYEDELCFGVLSRDLQGGGAVFVVYGYSSSCDDGNQCTNEYCSYDTKTCASSLACDDGNGCTIEYCGDVYCYSLDKCDDGNPCTANECDSVTYECSYEFYTCDDFSVCTEDICDEFGCHNYDTCYDYLICTDDYCDPDLGCYWEEVGCDDFDECTIDSCNEVIGCVNSIISCFDDSECTKDSCDPAVGCVFESICDDHDSCTIDSCEDSGCVHTPVDCNDDLFCTRDYCNPILPPGESCVNEVMTCHGSDQCKVGYCDETSKSCKEADRVCDDGLYCTLDSCALPGGCKYVQRDCNDTDPCTIDVCNNDKKQCEHINSGCDDNNLCTSDSCTTKGCVFTEIDCDDGDECTIDTCLPQKGCVHSPRDCQDGNECTVDACDKATGCTHSNTCSSVGCTSTSDCTFSGSSGCSTLGCISGTCVLKTNSCDDGNFCTADSCLSGRCFHMNIC